MSNSGAISKESKNRLAEHLQQTLSIHGPLSLTPVAGGQSNPTFFLEMGRTQFVLRKQPSGPLLKSAHAIDREFRVLKALGPTDIPVPETVLYYADTDILDTPFYLMERLNGRIFYNAALADIGRYERREVYFAMAETLAQLHALDPADIGLSDFGRPGSYFERQLSRWTRQWHASPTSNIPQLDELTLWLNDNLPSDDGQIALAHGDYRLGNLVFHPDKPKVIGVLDWELSTIGHPLADLGFACMPWLSSPDEYGGLLGLDLDALGIPEKSDFVDRYYGSAVDTEAIQAFHQAFALFRFAVIFVGIGDRAREGTASARNARELSPLAQRFAERAINFIRASKR